MMFCFLLSVFTKTEYFFQAIHHEQRACFHCDPSPFFIIDDGGFAATFSEVALPSLTGDKGVAYYA